MRSRTKHKGGNEACGELFQMNIDGNVPIPSEGRRTGCWQSLVVKMQVGDSILVPGRRSRDALRAAIKRIFGPESAVTRAEESGFRVWRRK